MKKINVIILIVYCKVSEVKSIFFSSNENVNILMSYYSPGCENLEGKNSKLLLKRSPQSFQFQDSTIKIRSIIISSQ